MNYEELSKKMDYWKELIEARKYSKAIDSLIENGKFEAYPVKFMIRDAPDPSEFASEILEAAVIENKPELVKFTLLCNRRKKDINILIELAIALDNLSMVKGALNNLFKKGYIGFSGNIFIGVKGMEDFEIRAEKIYNTLLSYRPDWCNIC